MLWAELQSCKCWAPGVSQDQVLSLANASLSFPGGLLLGYEVSLSAQYEVATLPISLTLLHGSYHHPIMSSLCRARHRPASAPALFPLHSLHVAQGPAHSCALYMQPLLCTVQVHIFLR